MKCKSGYYYCYTDKVCKKIPAGLKMTGKYLGGGREPEEVGIDKPLESGDENGGDVSESKSSNCNKVKSQYLVSPSIYASGALDETKKENSSDWRNEIMNEGEKKYKKVYEKCVKEDGSMSPQELMLQKKKARIDRMIAQKRQQQLNKDQVKEIPTKALGEDLKCNHTHKDMECPVHGKLECDGPKGGNGGKPGRNKNYVKPMGEDIELTDAYGEPFAVIHDIIKPEPLKPTKSVVDFDITTYDIESITEGSVRIPSKTGHIILVSLMWRAKYYDLKMFFPMAKLPNRSDVQCQINKVYPGAKVISYATTNYVPGNPLLHAEAWTKKRGRSKKEKIREEEFKSYERENPGSNNKASSKNVRNSSLPSFCTRLKT